MWGGVYGYVLDGAAHEGDYVGVLVVDGFGAEILGEGEGEAVAGTPGAGDGGEGSGGGWDGERFAVELDGGRPSEPGGDAEVDGEGGWVGGRDGESGGVGGGVEGLLGEGDGGSGVSESEARGGEAGDVEARRRLKVKVEGIVCNCLNQCAGAAWPLPLIEDLCGCGRVGAVVGVVAGIVGWFDGEDGVEEDAFEVVGVEWCRFGRGAVRRR